MQMRYTLEDPAGVEYVRAIKHFPNMGWNVREILPKWYDTLLWKVNLGAAFCEDQPADNDTTR